MTTPSEVLTVEQFAEKMQVSRTTVFSWIKTGAVVEGVHYLRLGRIVRFRWPCDHLFNNRPPGDPADTGAAPPPLPSRRAEDFQPGEARVNNPPLPFQRREGPVINLDY